MDVIKIIGIGLISLIIVIILKQYKPEFTIYVSIIAGVLICFLVMARLTNIVVLLQNLSKKADINNSFLSILLKITGISILTEYASSLCRDSSETAIANKIEFGSKVIIISLSIPIIQSLLELIIKIMP